MFRYRITAKMAGGLTTGYASSLCWADTDEEAVQKCKEVYPPDKGYTKHLAVRTTS